jgi:branched-chain amino acid transport system ATP-binding protein
MTALLELDRVSRRFGGLLAVHNLSFAMREGEILGLIGPNGAGKSTLFNLINGVFPPNSGRIVLPAATLPASGRSWSHAAVSLAPIRSCSRSRI